MLTTLEQPYSRAIQFPSPKILAALAQEEKLSETRQPKLEPKNRSSLHVLSGTYEYLAVPKPAVSH